MARYFDYSDWELENLCNSIRERIAESKKPLPPKVMKHGISILKQVSDCTFACPMYGVLSYGIRPEFSTKSQAEKYMRNNGFIEVSDNFWIEENNPDDIKFYTDKDGKETMSHYVIREYDYEVYTDGEYHTEYTEEEKAKLSEALYNIEKGLAYMRAYDHCCDQSSFGGDGFTRDVQEELERFEKTYTEELPEGYFEEDDD